MEKNKTNLKKYHNYQEELIYHYCSVDSLYWIINSRSLWLTSLNSSNDAQELKIGKKLVHEVIDELIGSTSNEVKKDLYTTVQKEATERVLKNEMYTGNYYAACFVQNRDSLTHWQNYGNNSEGVCIALNKWMFDFMYDYYRIPEQLSNWLKFRSIIYKPQEQKEYLTRFIEGGFTSFIEDGIELGILPPDTDLTYYQRKNPDFAKTVYYAALNVSIPIMKHHGFVDEDEVRLYLMNGEGEEQLKVLFGGNLPDLNPELIKNIRSHHNEVLDMLQLRKKDLKHACIGGQIRSYFAMNLAKMWSNALIPEIIIGPKCYQNKAELKSYLNSNGLKGTRLSVSKIPVR